MKIFSLIILTLIFIFGKITAQDNLSALLPMPNYINLINGKKDFTVTEKTVIKTNLQDTSYCIKELQRIFQERMEITLHISASTRDKQVIHLILNPKINGSESYSLSISNNSVKIEGATHGAILYGIMTLEQILIGDVSKTKSNKITQIGINDAPRFGYRSLMLDPARHFLPVNDVKIFIDQMVKYKYNTLQLHLTDDQGWRIEIKGHPQLTKNGDFYTQDELKDLVRYAAERNIQIIPELDIPGHTVAFLATYPHLGCSNTDTIPKIPGKTLDLMLCAANDNVYPIYNDIITTVANIFPSPYIHLGGDEAVVAKNWAKCEHCRALTKRLGYNNANQLMGYFFGKIMPTVYEAGKKPMFWCEIENNGKGGYEYLFNYPKDAILFTWRNDLTPSCTELTEINGNRLIMSPSEYAYLDYPQYKNDFPEFNNWGMPITTLETVYSFDPGYGLLPEKQEHIVGINGTLWAEAIPDINRVTYMAFPRALALAEAGWTEMENRGWESFKSRMYPNIMELMKCGVSIRVPYEIVDRENK
ncbi:MAG: beta-N-acetylhexosaminidase [Bacteroidales bacterium]